MWGRKGQQIAELEQMLAAQNTLLEGSAVTLNRVADQTSAMRAKIVNQRKAIHELERAVAKSRDTRSLHATVNRARLLISGWVKPEPGRHDGNHPVGECEPCDVFRALAPYGQDWHHVIRAHGSSRVGAE